MKSIPGRISQAAFRNTLKSVTKGNLVNPAYRALRREGLGNLKYKQSVTKQEMTKAYKALAKQGGVIKQTGLRAAGFFSRGVQHQQRLSPNKPSEPSQKEQQKVRRLQNEAVDLLLKRKQNTSSIGEFRKSQRRLTQQQIDDSKKEAAGQGNKKNYSRPTMAPMTGSRRVDSQRPQFRRRIPVDENYERNIASLEKGLVKDKVAEKEISVGDRVSLTKNKLEEIQKSGDLSTFQLTIGVVNDIRDDILLVDFGGEIKELLKYDVELVLPENEKLSEVEQKPDTKLNQISLGKGQTAGSTEEPGSTEATDEKKRVEDMFIG